MPASVRRTAQRAAEQEGTSFSSVVVDALEIWLRGRLIDAWLAEHQERHGAFDEEELRRLSVETGVGYLPPGRR